MAQTIGTIILVVLALVAVSAVLNFVLGVLGIVLALLPKIVMLAVFGGIIYLAWLVFRKLTHTTES
jgi:hypothetical protein